MDLKEGKMFLQLYTSTKKRCHICFYDFACQLSEYCLNREPELVFSRPSFGMICFHSITHVCGNNFKSVRIEGLEGINTEICEQFNGFPSVCKVHRFTFEPRTFHVLCSILFVHFQ